MIITRLRGGLGNQLFQYALGRKLSIRNSTALKLDISGLDTASGIGDTYRPFALDAFKIDARISTPEEIRKIRYPLGLLSELTAAIRFKILRQHHAGWEAGILHTRDNSYLDGYWQSPKYFEDIRDTIVADLELKEWSPAAEAMLAKIQAAECPVAVHVRRGDYVSNAAANATHGTCSLTYYKGAIAHIAERAPNAMWFVFSDDPAWVKEHVRFPADPTFVSGGDLTDAEELMLMAACSHNIISNSTFSWWGAWLNQNPEKTVVAPDPWSNSGKPSLADIIPPTWTLLPRD